MIISKIQPDKCKFCDKLAVWEISYDWFSCIRTFVCDDHKKDAIDSMKLYEEIPSFQLKTVAALVSPIIPMPVMIF